MFRIEYPTTVDGSEIRRENQWRLVVYPIVYKDLYMQPVVVWDFWNIKWPLFLVPKGIVLKGLTFKNWGHLGFQVNKLKLIRLKRVYDI